MVKGGSECTTNDGVVISINVFGRETGDTGPPGQTDGTCTITNTIDTNTITMDNTA